MEYGKIAIVLILILLAVTVSGCTQPDEKIPAKDQPVKYSNQDSQYTDAMPGDPGPGDNSGIPPGNNQAVQTVDKTQKGVTFEEEVCNAAEDADACGTKLQELGIVSRNDCCQIYKKCC